MIVTSLGLDPQLVLADIVTRLDAEASDLIPRSAIAEMVEQCLLDLQPVCDAALPEMLERLARHRLKSYLGDASLWLD